MKIIVTGCAGFIGYHLTKKYLEKNIKVIGIDNLNDYYSVKLKKDRLKDLYNHPKSKNFFFNKVSLENFNQLKKIFLKHKVSIVVNLAAQAGVRNSIIKPIDYVKSNLVGFSNIIILSKEFNIKHFVYASTSSVYGNSNKTKLSEFNSVDHPIQFYAATKRSNELIAHSYSSLFNIPTTGLRFFTVYGPWGRPDMALFKFTDKIIKRKPIKKETSKVKNIKVSEKKTLKEEMKELCIEIYDSDSDSSKNKCSSKSSIKQLSSNMYINQDDKSNKFWKIEYMPNDEGEYRIEYGRMGKPGKIESKSDTWIKIKKLIDSKIKKGYKLDSEKRIDCFSLNL